MTMDTLLLILVWLVPLGFGLLQFAHPQKNLPFAAWSALPALVAALVVPVGTVLDVHWFMLGTQFKLDAIGQPFLLFTSLLWLAASIFGASYLRADSRHPRFFTWFQLAMAGNLGLITAGDMLAFYLFFALMSFASYGLVVHNQQEDALAAGRVYIVLVILGEVLLFAALVLIASETGSLLLSDIAQAGISNLGSALVLISFGIKAGVVLLHVWLPLAHPAAPVPASAVLSGAMIKAGVIGWLRFLHPANGDSDWGTLIIALGLVTAVYGALAGISQVNPKTVLAYSSISQMGFIMIGVGLWKHTADFPETALLAVILYATHHALAKAALFLGVAMAGANRIVPVFIMLPALALAGLPFTSGAIAKAALKSVADGINLGWNDLLSTGLSVAAVGSTLLMARFVWLIWHSPNPQKPPGRRLWIVWLALLGGVAFLVISLPVAGMAFYDSLKPDKLITALVPIVVGALMAWVMAMLARRLPGLKLPLVPPGDVLEGFVQLLRIGTQLLHRVLGSFKAVQVQMSRRFANQNLVSVISSVIGQWEFKLRSDFLAVGSILLLISLGILLSAWLQF